MSLISTPTTKRLSIKRTLLVNIIIRDFSDSDSELVDDELVRRRTVYEGEVLEKKNLLYLIYLQLFDVKVDLMQLNIHQLEFDYF